MRRRSRVTTMLALAAALAATCAPAASAAAPQIHISGHGFVDAAGTPMRLIGTTAGVGSGLVCLEPAYDDPPRLASGNVFSTPADDHQLDLMRGWHMNTVRVTLNESCWLGLAPVRHRAQRIDVLRGAAGRRAAVALRDRYRRAITSLVRRAHAKGFVTIVDLHLAAPGRSLAYGQWPLPDRDHAPAFWRSVARTFKADGAMVFEVFNEPYAKSWRCLLRGCTLPNSCAECSQPQPGCPLARCPTGAHPARSYRTAGMQLLVDAIRATGATQPLLVPGLNYSNDLSQWLSHRPTDPLHQLGATFHMYGDGGCRDVACWRRQVAPVAAVVPVVATEFGQYDCAHDVMDAFQNWADERAISYQAWGWYASDFPPCGHSATDPHGDPAMLQPGYDGTPTPEGAGFKAHLQTLHALGELP